MSVSVSDRFRLAVLTCAAMPGFYPDDAPLVEALRARSVEPVSCAWDDAAIDWSQFDAVLIRTPWDYFQRFGEFVRWLERLPVPMINPAAVVRWNADKRYLLELEAQGVAIIPMRVVAGQVLHGAVRQGAPDKHGSGANGESHASAWLSDMEGRDVVVKPTVSGGAWHTVRGVVGSPEFDAAVAALPVEFDYLVQDFVPEIVADGEWSLLFFDGHYSHAVIKRAKSGDYRVQGVHGGSVETVSAPAALIASAQRVLAATAALGYADVAYARVDGVVVDGAFQLMELEVIEPALFFEQRPEAGDALAEAVLRRLAAQAP
jgi:glutathione synthase/RimK-type ligase-like ATP-grasp enzyme